MVGNQGFVGMGLQFLEYQRWRHGGEHSFFRLDGIRLSARHAEHIGNAGLGRKIIHLVVQEKSRTFNNNTGTEGTIQRRRVGNAIPPPVDNREMRCLLAFSTPV